MSVTHWAAKAHTVNLKICMTFWWLTHLVGVCKLSWKHYVVISNFTRQNGVQKVNGSSFHVTFTVHSMPNKLNTCTTAFQRSDGTWHAFTALLFYCFTLIFSTSLSPIKRAVVMYTHNKYILSTNWKQEGFCFFFSSQSCQSWF